VPDVPIDRLTVAQYHTMAEAGILTEDDPVELLEGWLVRKMTEHGDDGAAWRCENCFRSRFLVYSAAAGSGVTGVRSTRHGTAQAETGS
jgi:hypothetical protein